MSNGGSRDETAHEARTRKRSSRGSIVCVRQPSEKGTRVVDRVAAFQQRWKHR